MAAYLREAYRISRGQKAQNWAVVSGFPFPFSPPPGKPDTQATGSMEGATAEVRGSKVVPGDKARTTEEQTGN